MRTSAASALSPACSLHAILAPRSTRAVIFRRGPSKHTCLIAWDRARDTFEVGQWFKGRVYAERCALSPDGTWLLSFMASFRPPFQTWTALSKPPYFTAVALWPLGGTYGGGGTFLNDREIVLHHGRYPGPAAPGFEPPSDFHVRASMPADRRRAGLGKKAEGWVLEKAGMDDVFETRQGPDGTELNRMRDSLSWEWSTILTISQNNFDLIISNIGWSDFDTNGDLLFTRSGVLYRLDASRLADLRPDDDIVALSRCLADFTDLRFRPLAAPYAGCRPTGERLEERSFAPAIDSISKANQRAARKARQSARQ